MREFVFRMPARFQFTESTQEAKDREVEEYLSDLSRTIEDTLTRMFRVLAVKVDSPTAGNLVEVDEDGQLVDSGFSADDVGALL